MTMSLNRAPGLGASCAIRPGSRVGYISTDC